MGYGGFFCLVLEAYLCLTVSHCAGWHLGDLSDKTAGGTSIVYAEVMKHDGFVKLSPKKNKIK